MSTTNIDPPADLTALIAIGGGGNIGPASEQGSALCASDSVKCFSPEQTGSESDILFSTPNRTNRVGDYALWDGVGLRGHKLVLEHEEVVTGASWHGVLLVRK